MLGLLARLWHRLYGWAFWRNPDRRAAVTLLRAAPSDAIHANDWDGLAVSVEASRSTGARIVFDSHEYAPLQFETRRWWWLIDKPQRIHILKTYASAVDAAITVSPLIAERLSHELPVAPILVFNAPRLAATPAAGRGLPGDAVRLVHHGMAGPGREPERMIRTIALCDPRFTLDFMLVGNEEYIDHLRQRAAVLTPGRVNFRTPVPPAEIVQVLTEYDIGIHILPENTFNHRANMPNKLFDFLCAGLGVCIGPTETMAALVRRYRCGVIAPSFEPEDVASALAQLDHTQIRSMQEAAWEAARTEYNADQQMAKLVALYADLLS